MSMPSKLSRFKCSRVLQLNVPLDLLLNFITGNCGEVSSAQRHKAATRKHRWTPYHEKVSADSIPA